MYKQIKVESVELLQKLCKELKEDLLVIEVPVDHNPHYSNCLMEYELNGNTESDKSFIPNNKMDYYIYSVDEKHFAALLSKSVFMEGY